MISYLGLDNLGSTSYLNSTLQCLANIKPVTNYLLNLNHYTKLYNNQKICLITIEYIQILIGLYCNKSRTGSYCPKNFKKIISEINLLFRGSQENDPKDLIIFLLELINNELVMVNNLKKINNKINEDESYQCDSLEKCQKYFIKSHCSIIGDNLYGFQKNNFACQNCGGNYINYNIFNYLMFSLEATSNYFDLKKNNNIIPVINFDYFFQFLSKDENLSIICQKCKKLSNIKYKQSIYIMPYYLIIILDREKENIYNFQVKIPEIFCPFNYVENEKDSYFNLIGIISHIDKHFISLCKHNIDGKWRCYNDNIVTECQNDIFEKGIPYILFYQKKSTINYDSNQINKVNLNLNFNYINNQFNNEQIFFSNQMNMNYNIYPSHNNNNNLNINMNNLNSQANINNNTFWQDINNNIKNNEFQ